LLLDSQIIIQQEGVLIPEERTHGETDGSSESTGRTLRRADLVLRCDGSAHARRPRPPCAGSAWAGSPAREGGGGPCCAAATASGRMEPVAGARDRGLGRCADRGGVPSAGQAVPQHAGV